MKKSIAVLFGGCSSEYMISLKSAYAVLSHTDHEKYKIIPVGITKDGRWFRYYGEYENIANDTWTENASLCRAAFLSPDRGIHGLCELTETDPAAVRLDAVFPVLHGRFGEDGTVQGLAELAGIPIVGCGCLSSALNMDKYRAHLLAQAAGIKVPKSVLISEGVSLSETEKQIERLSYPLFVKPLRGGSSLGITKITDPKELSAALRTAAAYDSELIIEENVEGFETGCAILGKGSRLTCGRADEIELSCFFFDYTQKYTQESARIHMPARVDEQTEKRIQKTAKKIYRILDCGGFARVDLFLTPNGEIVFNEVNTIPGFTEVSRFPSMLSGIGMGYGQIIETVISDALEEPEAKIRNLQG